MSKLTEAHQTIAKMEAKIAELVAASQAALELVGIVTAERDSLAAQVEVMRNALVLASKICDTVPSRDSSDIGKLVNHQPDGTHGYRLIHDALESTPQHHLAAHDAEVAANAVKQFAAAIYETGELGIEDAEFTQLFASEYVAENFSDSSVKAG